MLALLLDESQSSIYMKETLSLFRSSGLVTLSHTEDKMSKVVFQDYFTATSLTYLKRSIALTLDEDGPDLTARGIFPPNQCIGAHIVAKEKTLVAGLPLIALIFSVYEEQGGGACTWQASVQEGALVDTGTEIVRLQGACIDILKLERVILNYIARLSGVANITAQYAQMLEGTGVKLLDTRKTLPGLRWLEKYAVRVGGGYNHRRDLQEMLMIKDNHIDACGSITKAVEKLRAFYTPCPPIEVECRTYAEVQEAVNTHVERIMLDNMPICGQGENTLKACLPLIPKSIEAEISGGVSYENLRDLALCDGVTRPADYISVGRLTHSAVNADFSLRIVDA